MKRTVLLAASLIWALASTGQMAIADTLHGFCVAPATCTDNGTITATSSNPLTFGFDSSGTTQGSFELVALVPNNEDPTPSTYSLGLNSTNLTTVSVTGGLFSTTAFTSGDLESYLGVSSTPTNPLSSFLPSTDSVDAGATGYYVYLFNFGLETGNPKNDATAPTFSFPGGSSLQLGTVLLGFEFTGSGFLTGSIFGGTPSSAAILETSTFSSTPTPEPTTLALFGFGLVGLGLIWSRRRAAQKS